MIKYFPLLFLCLCACSPKTQIPFGNFDFETLNADSTSGFQHWRVGKNTSAKVASIAISGKNGIALSGAYTDNEPGYFYQHKPFVTNKLQRYKISAKVKTEAVENGGAGVYAYGKKGERYMSYTSLTPVNGTTDWQDCSIQIWLNEEVDHFRVGGQLTGSGSAWFDDFSVTIVPPSGLSPAPEIASYLDTFLLIVKEKSLYRKVKDINLLATDLRLMCSDAKTYEDCFNPMTYLLNRLDNHSFIMPAAYANQWSGGGENEGPKTIPLATGRLIDKDYGYISMPGCNAGDSLTQIFFAEEMQNLLDSLDHENIKGWILDLRENTGGNCWPMLAGIGPLLGEGINGYFQTEADSAAWFYKNGSSGIGEAALVTVQRKPYELKKKNPRVAVLTGPRTGSSGEVVTVAFRKRPNTKSFGTATAGLSTGNQNYLLPGGSFVFLCTSVYADREGEPYGKVIIPDIVVEPAGKEGADLVLKAAMDWLEN
jgi:carboxyl-terminal processing protease